MKNYYFILGAMHMPARYLQLVVANSMKEAEAKMIEVRGRNFKKGYTQREYIDQLKKGNFRELKPLKPIYASEMMKAGEMRSWSSRLRDILQVEGCLKETRLSAMKNDLELVKNCKDDYFASKLHETVLEEIERV